LRGDTKREIGGKLTCTHTFSKIWTICLFLEKSHTKQTPKGLSEGSNYYIPIYESEDSEIIKAILWAVDSQEENCHGISESWGCILPDIVEWVEKVRFKKTKIIIENLYLPFLLLKTI